MNSFIYTPALRLALQASLSIPISFYNLSLIKGSLVPPLMCSGLLANEAKEAKNSEHKIDQKLGRPSVYFHPMPAIC